MKMHFVKHKTMRALLALVLSLAMIFTALPMPTFAEGDQSVISDTESAETIVESEEDTEMTEDLEESTEAVIETNADSTELVSEEEAIPLSSEEEEITPLSLEDDSILPLNDELNPLENSAYSQGFELWFNPDGETGIEAGQQGDYPVFAGEAMAAKTNKVDYYGTTYYSVQGKTNPKLGGSNPNGAIPDLGAYLKVVAPADGTITVYGYPAAGKTFYATKGDTPQITDANAFSEYSYTVSVLAGEEWYFYAQGSKAQFAGVIFELPKAAVTLPLEFIGEDLGDASITFTNNITGDAITVGASDTSITLTTGYTYTVSINSALLVIDLAALDLNGTLPEKISIVVSAAPQHVVSGSFQGLPEGAVVVALTYIDEAGVESAAAIEGNSYSIGLKNGNYTAAATVIGADEYTVYDHVAVVGMEGEAISNDVWFYAPAKTYSSDYVAELSVGIGRDYATISEAVAAAAAMNRTEGQYVTLVLYDSEYVEQVVINTPNIKLVAAEGVTPTIRWYYGIGYKYYSIDSTGYYNEKNANDKYDMHYAVKWGAVVNIQSKASGFLAEGINFVNTFNLYVAQEELGDSAVGSAAEYGQSISGSLQERVSGLDVANTTNVERAAAVVCDGDYAEFYNCSFVSSQDTLYTGTGHQYYRNCVIEGQTDYIFGNTGTNCIFDDCDLVWLGYTASSSKAGYITATRGNYLFRNCSIQNNSADGYTVTPGYFGRPWGSTANVIFLYTDIQEGSMNEDSWYNMSGVNPEDATFREYGNYVGSDTSNFYYSNYATTNLTFCLTKAQAEELANPANDTTYLSSWTPVHHITEAVDLSSVDDWYVGKEEKVWKFVYFGTSTSAAANTILDGADINDKVSLTSCTYNEDGTINKKGGKFVADSPADGESFYYTTINPRTENFYLQADVYIDYINPTPDGQEGFALMVRDSIGGSGSYFSNTASITGTKLPTDGLNGVDETKDVVGVRDYTGMIANEDAASNSVVAYRQGFSSDLIETGKTYRVSLEKTSNGYVSTYYDINADGSTGEVIGSYTLYIPAKDSNATSVSSYDELDDPMTVQEADKAYVALVVARGCNATFSNIVFTTSDWNAADWAPQETVYIAPDYSITSPSTCAEDTYELVFKANADGIAKVYANGEVVASDIQISANEEFTGTYSIQGDTTFAVEFTPNSDYIISPYEKLSDYSTKTVSKEVTYRTFENIIYVAPDGVSTNGGTSFNDAVDVQTALSYASAGQTILLQAGTYDLSGKALTIERGRDGNEENPITLTTEGGYATFDFGKTGSGFTAGGAYWNMSFINITNSANGMKGMQLSGYYNTLERMNFYNNGNTGLQISGSSTETIDKWPSYNLIKNCTSINNADAGYEDADGFAAKLTVGYGNVFDGCISAYNADDGWDLFAKAATGSIGAVTIQNSVAYRNGYVLASALDDKGNVSEFADINCDENGTLTFGNGVAGADWSNASTLYGYTVVDAGNGNGFKMGGTNLPGDHKLINSISYENKAKGIDSNSCTDIKAYNSTTYNNESYNVAMYTGNKSAVTGYIADGVLSFRVGTNVKEQLAPQSQSSTDIYGANNYYWNESTQTSTNTASNPTTVSEDWFISLDTSIEPARNEDGSINMHNLLLLTDAALAYETGARGAVWGQAEAEKATIWVVGDSTVSAFTDKYYLPREGYGEEIATYFNADVYNLAHSGASSKDFITMSEYTTLLNGSDTVPAMSQITTDNFLIIGFGHNDEKTEDARYTNPNGDYLTEGSFANSLYVNYIKPALDAGVTPIVVTPIVRLTDENTEASYNSSSGHITTDTIVGDTVYEGGDYAQAIRDMCDTLGIQCVDLTAATIQENVALGEGAQWLHAFTGAKYAEDGETLTATGLDKTHTNSYGAKLHAWLIAELSQGTILGSYSKNKEKPTYEANFADAINPDFVPSNYKAPTEEEMAGSQWPVYTDANGNVWYGTVFGDIGGQGNVTDDAGNIKTDFFNAVIADDNSDITLSVTGNKGKVASASEGMMFYYTRLPAGTNFTLTATAQVNDLAANNQVSFGLMARDDLYINSYVSSTMGDYVAAATRNQGAVNGFGRKSTALFNGPDATKVYGIGDIIDLKIVGTNDGFTLTYGENAPVSAGFDYALTAVDPDYIYVGFYVIRNANVTFSNISLEVESNECTHDNLIKVEEVPATCEEAGNIAYWYCETCGKYFSDAQATIEIALEDTIILATGHSLIAVEAKEATATEDGNIAYWYCEACDKYFSDAEGNTEISAGDVVIPATGEEPEKPTEDDEKVLIHVPAKDATETEDGNIEYWYSEKDGKYYLDEEGKTEVSAEEVIIPATGTETEPSEDDEPSTEDSNKPTPSVPTGDAYTIALWLTIFMLALFAVTFVVKKRREI